MRQGTQGGTGALAGQYGDVEPVDGKVRQEYENAPQTPAEDAETLEEEARLRGIREFLARDARRRHRRRALVTAASVVVGIGLAVTALTSVGWRGEDQGPPATAAIPAPLVLESREPLAPPPTPLPPPADSAPAPREALSPPPEPRPARARPSPVSPRPGSRSPSSASPPAVAARPAASAPRTAPPTVTYQPRARLASIRPGDTKDRVFETLATTVERRDGALVRTEGLRLRASGRSPHHALVEVADVRIAETTGGSLHWFLFGDGRLVAWGRAEEWASAADRFEVDSRYSPRR
jgi:hypothetical protein